MKVTIPMPRPPVLFLDFDGVMHAYGEPAFDENFQLLSSPSLFRWRPILEEILSPHTGVRIIVSSDWRRLFDDDNLVRLMGPALGPRFLGAVETFKDSRAAEIIAEATRRQLNIWLALDDHPSVVKASKKDKRFIACQPGLGLSSLDVQAQLRRPRAAQGLISPLPVPRTWIES